jgi:DnaK suppressor protein
MPASKKTDQVTSLIHGVKPFKVKKGEEYMNARMREHFREILTAWRQELLDEVARTVHSMQDETENHPDPNDRASQETDISLELRNRDRERKLIKKIDESIDTIETGDYGYCESCGVEIGIQRLEARPTANMCIDCKTLAEIREKQLA